ncbi:MAG TPA: pyridoxal 5'-phosphate synthase glutaminase subunit PdxT [Candidatus Binatia bacterium]|jgi:5'-phosphate synthase pdxT subunit|nr:pyridoxal 5'-phosphate synthase glutaminase subunit PdxT [Candidatus Binatia bacterium]
MKIGVLALQGAFLEHRKKLERLGVEVVEVRLPQDLEGLDGLIIPGGESTTIGKLAVEYGLVEPLKEFAREKPVWGTCAGMIFMARDIGMRQPLLGLMDITVRRNAFGRQVDSFETELPVEGLNGDGPFPAIFIRAPVIASVDDDKVQVLARLADGTPVAAREGHWLVTSFHPELSGDDRLHRYFIDLVRNER